MSDESFPGMPDMPGAPVMRPEYLPMPPAVQPRLAPGPPGMTQDMSIQLTINPETLLLDGASRDLLTAGQFAGLAPPACPVCGTTVEVARLDATPDADYEAAHGRGYLVGMWHCPHDCNPRTGQRVHYGQEYRRRIGDEAITCACTCGDTTRVLNKAEGAAWQAVHHHP